MATKTQHLQIRLTSAQKAALKRRAALAGQDLSSYVLGRALPSAALRLQELIGALGTGDEAEGEARYALAELNDLLAGLAPAEFEEATSVGDLSDLTPFHQNYVAAMVEGASHQRAVRPPSWTSTIPPLARPWFAAPLSSLRLHLLRASPVPFRRRNLFVDATVGDRA